MNTTRLLETFEEQCSKIVFEYESAHSDIDKDIVMDYIEAVRVTLMIMESRLQDSP